MRRAAAAEGVVDAGAGVAVRLGFFVWPQHLNPAGHGRQCRPAGLGIDEFQGNAIVGIVRRAR